MPQERDRQILDLNPWWTDARAIQADPHLQTMRRGPFVWDPPVMEDIGPRPGAVHMLRGPRQVGKTTTAKRLIEQLLEGGERRVLYYSFDLESEARAIPEIIQRAKEMAVRPAGPWYLFLDEVTAIPDWQLELRVRDVQQRATQRRSEVRRAMPVHRIAVLVHAAISRAGARKGARQ